MSCKEAKVVVPVLTFLLPRGYESNGQKISDLSVCVLGTAYKSINISTRKESYFMELFHVLSQRKKDLWESKLTSREAEGLADLMGTCRRLTPSWKRRWVPSWIAKDGCLYVTTELSSQHASFYPGSKECHQRCFRKVNSLSKDVVRDLFNSVCVKCNRTNTPSVTATPSPFITRLQSKLGKTEINIITTISYESHKELKHKAICLKSLNNPAAEPGQEAGVSCGSLH